MVVDGRNKGARYMVDVCRILSHWICGTAIDAKAHELAFRPRSTSIMPVEGHWNGAGDILHRPDVTFPFCVECKKQEGGDLGSILDARRWPVWDWWDQAVAQANRVDSIPLLIFARNRRENSVLMRRDTAEWLGLQPLSAPVLDIRRPNDGERLTLCLLRDLAARPVPKMRKRRAS